MRYLLAVALFFHVVVALDPRWKLLWGDEFTESSLDTTHWTAVNNRYVYNDEQEWYDPAQVYIQNGHLVLKTNPDSTYPSTNPYASGEVNTENKFTLTNNVRIEIMGQLPYGQGMWPAYWLLGTNGCDDAEVDIIEVLGMDPTYAYGSWHYGPTCTSSDENGHGRYHTGANLAQDFHLYSLELNHTDLVFAIDTDVYEVANNYSDYAEVPHYLIINTAVGGPSSWGGTPNASNVFPQYHYIDYVRIYGWEPCVTGCGANGCCDPVNEICVCDSNYVGTNCEVQVAASGTKAVCGGSTPAPTPKPPTPPPTVKPTPPPTPKPPTPPPTPKPTPPPTSKPPTPAPTPKPPTPAPTSKPPTVGQIIYDDKLENGWYDPGSWTQSVVYNNPSPVHSGSDSVAVVYTPWRSWYIQRNTSFTTTDYDGLSFWMNGGTTGGQHINVGAVNVSWASEVVGARYVLPFAIANTWSYIQVSWADLQITGKQVIVGFYIGENDGDTDATMYFDDVMLYKNSPATPAPTPKPTPPPTPKPTPKPTPPPTPKPTPPPTPKPTPPPTPKPPTPKPPTPSPTPKPPTPSPSPIVHIGPTSLTPSASIPVGIECRIAFTVTITGTAFTGNVLFGFRPANDTDNLDVIGSQFSEEYNFPLGVSSFNFPFTMPANTPSGSYKAVVGVYDAGWTKNIAWSDPAIVFTACAACCVVFDAAHATPNPVARGSTTVVSWNAYTNCAYSGAWYKASLVPPTNWNNTGSISAPQNQMNLVAGTNTLSLSAAIPTTATAMTYRTTLGVWTSDWETTLQFEDDGIEIVVS